MPPSSPVKWKLKQLWLKTRCRFSSDKAITYQLNPDLRFVAHLADVSSHNIYINGSYEERELKWCSNWLTDGDCFVDCGANIGYYTASLLQLRKLKQVLAIEGNDTCLERCKITFNRLGISNVDLIKGILHSDEGISLNIPDLPGEEGLQHAVEQSGEGSTLSITLDQLLEQKNCQPSLIKIDCEGAETEILKGAKRTLAEHRPAWLIEVNDNALVRSGSRREELFPMLKDAGYKLFHIASTYVDIPVGLEVDVDLQSWSFNMAVIPDAPKSIKRWEESIRGFNS